MTDMLFTIPETPSPRLLWMRRHGITTGHDSASLWHPAVWWAKCGKAVATGGTEDEALAGLARSIGVPLWNEESKNPLTARP